MSSMPQTHGQPFLVYRLNAPSPMSDATLASALSHASVPHA